MYGVVIYLKCLGKKAKYYIKIKINEWKRYFHMLMIDIKVTFFAIKKSQSYVKKIVIKITTICTGEIDIEK